MLRLFEGEEETLEVVGDIRTAGLEEDGNINRRGQDDSMEEKSKSEHDAHKRKQDWSNEKSSNGFTAKRSQLENELQIAPFWNRGNAGTTRKRKPRNAGRQFGERMFS